uniref:Uncharacterized protein n=1 Tax=Plectus sambesii TaxID=2011161 RepID=A0A914UUU2_9BILA
MKFIKLEPIHAGHEHEYTLKEEKEDDESKYNKTFLKTESAEQWLTTGICHLSVAGIQIKVGSITNEDYISAAKAMLKAACDHRYLAQSHVFSVDVQLFNSTKRSKKLNALRKLYEVNKCILSSLLMSPVKLNEGIAYDCDVFPRLRMSKNDEGAMKCHQCMARTAPSSSPPMASKIFSFDGSSYDETSLTPVRCAIDTRIKYLCARCANRVRLYHSLSHTFYTALTVNIRRIAVRCGETEEDTPKRTIAHQILEDYKRTNGEHAEIFWQDLRCDWFDALHL